MKAVEQVFADLKNGNLTDAKRRAKHFTSFRLSMYARQVLGYEFDLAVKSAAYLKGECDFQTYCDSILP
jgi:hypothetical protein